MLKQQMAKKIRVIHKITGKYRVENQRACSSRMEIFKRLLRKGMNKLDIDEVKVKVLM